MNASAPEKLFSYEFVVLALAATFGFCNIAIFYSFSVYLERLGLDPAWRGVVIAAEPLAAVLLRPVLSVLLTPGAALAVARVSLLAMGAALASYQFAHALWALLAVRLVHGAAFVCLVSAVMVLLVRVIPKAQSGRAFGLFSLSALLPYAVMPPLVEWLLGHVDSEAKAYAWAALLVVPAVIMLLPLSSRLGPAAMSSGESRRMPLADLVANLRRVPVALVLGANLAAFLSSTVVFYYMKAFAMGLSVADPGLFFTVSTGASIAVRVGGNALFDKLPKQATLAGALLALAVCLAFFGRCESQLAFFVLTAAYGLCLGVALPLLNAVMFLQSEPGLRGMNMNLMLFMMDGGYVLGPLLGGALLERGYGYPGLFAACAGFAFTACALIALLVLKERPTGVR